MANSSTFLDESFQIGHALEPIVSAHFADTADLQWLNEVALRSGRPHREVKYATVKQVLRSADRDLALRVRRGAGQAVIIICDETPFRAEAAHAWRDSRIGPQLQGLPAASQIKFPHPMDSR